MAAITAVYDACVLYPDPLRDFLVQLSISDVVRACWTESIHQEWMRAVLERRPDLAEKLPSVRQLMDAANPSGLVSGYESLIETLSLPDPDDRHVLAAALHAGADFIVTLNLRDFPPAALGSYEITAMHPDDFVLFVAHWHLGDVLHTARACRARLKRPPRTVDEYLAILERNTLTGTAALLKESAEHI